MAKGPICTGRQVEVIVGHYIAACISNRSGLSVPRAIYNFIRDCYCMPTRVWPSVRYECISMSNIVMHLRANWSRPWSDIATCSDASPNGIGVGERVASVTQIASIGRWNEKWRFKRLDPHEWCPRSRALGECPGDHVATYGNSSPRFASTR